MDTMEIMQLVRGKAKEMSYYSLVLKCLKRHPEILERIANKRFKTQQEVIEYINMGAVG